MQSDQEPGDGPSSTPSNLTKCGACERDIPTGAETCPHCGEPAAANTAKHTKRMWKVGRYVGVMMFLVGLWARREGTDPVFHGWSLMIIFGVVMVAASTLGSWLDPG